MKRKFLVTYSETVHYEPVEIIADSEDEAQDLLQEMIDKDNMIINDRDEYDLQVEDLGEEYEE